jgi:beta-lactam-binding protein with PASTA domain
VLRAGCKVKVVYKKSKRPKGIVLKQSRKAGKKLVYHAVVKLTVAVKQQPKVAKHKHS